MMFFSTIRNVLEHAFAQEILSWLGFIMCRKKAGGHRGAELEQTVAELGHKLEEANQRIARLERMFTNISAIAAMAGPDFH